MNEHDVQETLRRAFQAPDFYADLSDVRRRASKRARIQRVANGAVGLLFGAVAVAVVGVTIGRLNDAGPLAAGPVNPLGSGIVSDGNPPEGEMLIRSGPIVELLMHGTNQSVSLGTDINPYDLTADGSTVVATLGEQEPSGAYRQGVLITIDTTSGVTSTIARASATEGFTGPIVWSPDGASIAYTQVTWAVDPSEQPPGEPVSESACVANVAAATHVCFPDLGSAYSLDWSADGSQLLISGGLGEPVQVLNLGTSLATTVIPGDGGADVRAAIEEAGLGPIATVQLLDASWSSTGSFIAVVVQVSSKSGELGFMPLVFRADGTLVKTGSSNPDFQLVEWSPTQDLLAYSSGLVGPVDISGMAADVIHLLNPTDGSDHVILNTTATANVEGVSDPFILSLDWSPSGRWLAVGGRDEIRIVDTTAAEGEQTVDPYDGADGTIIDWAN